jgi:hypothetical protein
VYATGSWVDMFKSNHHHGNVLVITRFIAAAIVVALSASPVALCTGWQSSPEARMACCVEGVACAMHPSEDQDGIGIWVVTQAEADSCCAGSEQDDASPTAKSLAASIAPHATTTSSVLLPPVITRSAAWDRRPPDRAFTVPRNVLLSVFII